jgi:pimeloyl-ACP methyl ester carboxylesterase
VPFIANGLKRMIDNTPRRLFLILVPLGIITFTIDVTSDVGVRLRTWTTGTTTQHPPVVLLHGGPGLWDYLEPLARRTHARHDVPQRGRGGRLAYRGSIGRRTAR